MDMYKMLSLKKKDGAVHVCDIQRGRQKVQPVYYYYEVDDSLLMKVDDYRGLLKGSLPQIKDRLKINQEAADRAIDMLQSDKEPADDEKRNVRRAY